MNLLYQSLFPASLLPWFIIALFHFFHGYISLCLILTLHLSTHAVVILHRPLLDMDMIQWNKFLQLQRLALWVTYSFRNHWDQHFLSLILFVCISLNFKLIRERNIASEVIHTMCVLTYCSTAPLAPIVASMGCIVLYYYQKKPMKIQWQITNEVETYFNLRIGYNYTFAFIEWYLSGMSSASIILLLFVTVLFNVTVFTQIPDERKEGRSEWFDAMKLPNDYPYPLDISDAMERCNTAKKLFKSHQI